MADKVRLNNEIRAATVRLIGADGSQLGVVSRDEALRLADEAGYDLAEIAPNADPPVAKILDWGKYRYEQTKQQAASRRNQKQVEVKTVRLGLKIGDHDFDVKVTRARKFLNEGHKVKVSLLFRGREITHPELGRERLDRFLNHLEDVAAVEQPVQLSGRDLNMVIGLKKDAQTKNS
ncbi:MAG TPA: translation initiation factor IF-3 [Candidatus Nanoarchaeia archaeon]|nr:translation initiation factor IF-3 [Candidatus Nanoarchaeia archaeon]